MTRRLFSLRRRRGVWRRPRLRARRKMRNAERDVFLFRQAPGRRRRFRAAGVLRTVRALRLPAGLPARALSNARGVESRGHRSDRSESRVITDRNGIVLAQSYSAYTLELTPARFRNLEADHRRAGDNRRHPAARPQALPQAPRRIEEFREHAAAHEPVRRGSRALRGQSLPVPRRRDQGAAVPPVSVRRNRLACPRLHRPDQRTRPREHRRAGRSPPTTRAPTTSARSASSFRTSASCTARPVSRRSKSMRAAAPCARSRARRRLPATTCACRSTSAAGRGGGRVRRSPRRAGGHRARDRRHARVRIETRLSTRTSSSTASTRRTGTRSTIRRTSRCSIVRCAALIRRARRSSRSWRSAR